LSGKYFIDGKKVTKIAAIVNKISLNVTAIAEKITTIALNIVMILAK
jgi:hypothetical protein